MERRKIPKSHLPHGGLPRGREDSPLVEKGLLSVKRSLVPSLQVLNTPEENDKVSRCSRAPEHLLFGSTPLKDPKQDLA